MKNRNNQLGFGHIGILLVVLVLIVMSAAGYLVYSRNNKKDTNTKGSKTSIKSEEAKLDVIKTDQEKTSELKTQETVTTYTYNANDYTGWKEYCSKTEKACFNYPSDWVLQEPYAGQETDGVGVKITADYEYVTITNNNSNYGVTWKNVLSGLGGVCTDDRLDKENVEVVSYEKISSRPNDYIVGYTYSDAQGKTFYRLMNYDNQEPNIGRTGKCAGLFYYFFSGKDNTKNKNIYFESRVAADTDKETAKKVVRSFRYQ